MSNARNTAWGGQGGDGTATAVGSGPQGLPVENVKFYGAAGDGVTDDTVAIQTAINVALATTKRLFFPQGTYKITAALIIPFVGGWMIEGATRDGCTIKQFTANTPIFRFTFADTHSWTIRSLAFDYNAQQASGNTAACPFYFVGDPSTIRHFYNFTIEDVNFANCCYCIGVDASTKVAVWGWKLKDFTVASTVTGGLVTLVGAGGGGMPNIGFDHGYIRADSMVGPIFNMLACGACEIGNVEINSVNQGPTIYADVGGGSCRVGQMSVEGSTAITAVNPFFDTSGSKLSFDSLQITSITMNASVGGNPAIFRGGTGTQVYVRDLKLSMTISAGTYFVAKTFGDANGTLDIDRIAAIPASVVLTDIGSTVTARGVQIRSWNDNRISLDKGDADYTVADGDPNIISYETTLTAARTVTLPNPGAQVNVFQGLRYRVQRSAGGAFALNINRAPATLLDSIPSGKTGAIEYTWRWGAAGPSWVQTLKALV